MVENVQEIPGSLVSVVQHGAEPEVRRSRLGELEPAKEVAVEVALVQDSHVSPAGGHHVLGHWFSP